LLVHNALKSCSAPHKKPCETHVPADNKEVDLACSREGDPACSREGDPVVSREFGPVVSREFGPVVSREFGQDRNKELAPVEGDRHHLKSRNGVGPFLGFLIFHYNGGAISHHFSGSTHNH
jgi:hypothetical protein